MHQDVQDTQTVATHHALREAVLFINTTSGSGAKEGLVEQLGCILRERGGMAVRIICTAAHDLTERLQVLAREESASLPIIGGGDGTIRAAAQVMMGTRRPWGVLPLGTYNHFAQDLGFAAEPLEAAAQLATAVVRPIDVGLVNGHVFVNNASLGAYPLAVHIRDMLCSSMGLPKQLAMAYACWVLFWRYRLLTIDLETGEGGGISSLHAPFLLISNNLYEKKSLTAVGRPRLDAGLLGIYCLSQNNRWGFLRALFHGLIHDLRENEALVMLQAKRLRVRLQRQTVAVALDGEVFQLNTPLRFESRPAALDLLIPLTRIDP